MSQSENNEHEEVENEIDNEAVETKGAEAQEATDAAATEELSIEAQLEEAKVKADENWDTVLRMKADLENQRRRNEKQVEDAHKFAAKKFIEELLPVADSMEMGLAAEGDVDQIREGVIMTKKMFDTAMGKFGLSAVEPLGDKFDPELHQAMAMQPSEEFEEGCVSAVMQKGYTLNGRLVRPAMVMVVKN